MYFNDALGVLSFILVGTFLLLLPLATADLLLTLVVEFMDKLKIMLVDALESNAGTPAEQPQPEKALRIHHRDTEDTGSILAPQS